MMLAHQPQSSRYRLNLLFWPLSTVVAWLSDERNPKPAKSILWHGFLNPLPLVALGTSNVDSGMARVFGVVLDPGLTVNYTYLGLHKLVKFNFYYIKVITF